MQHGRCQIIRKANSSSLVVKQVDRIERAAAAACGTQSREDVIGSMYGRADPRPMGVHAMHPTQGLI